MPRRNGPQARDSGIDAPRDRLPRSIALRLARAGLMPSTMSARRPEALPADVDAEERRDDYPTTSPATFTR